MSDLLFELLKASVGLGTLVLLWLAVQSAWRRVFSDTPADEDVLAGRLGCHGCGCAKPCDKRDAHRHRPDRT